VQRITVERSLPDPRLNTRDRDEVSVVEDAEALLQGAVRDGRLKLPSGYYWEWSGQFENQVRAPKRMIRPLGFGWTWSASFYRGMLLLVAASPCALAIGTPAAVLAGIAQAARRGVLSKGGIHLESLGRLNTVALDKTAPLLEMLQRRKGNRWRKPSPGWKSRGRPR